MSGAFLDLRKAQGRRPETAGSMLDRQLLQAQCLALTGWHVTGLPGRTLILPGTDLRLPGGAGGSTSSWQEPGPLSPWSPWVPTPGDPPFTCGRWAPWNRAAHPALRNPRDLQNGVQPWTPARRRAGGPQRSLLPPGAVTRKAAGPPQGQEGRRPCLFGEGPVALPPRCPVFKGRKLFRGCFGLRTFHGRAVLLWHLQTGGGNSDSSADRLRQQTPLGKFTRERKAR